MRMRFLHIILFISCTILSRAQDIHFSQFYQSPFSLNPALTGQFDGDWRFVGNQRTQWRSVTVPYSTWGIAVDKPHLTKQDVNAGLSIFTDKAGDSQLTTTMINGAVSKALVLPNRPQDQLTVGLMLGLTLMSIDYSALNYDNQWNGLFYDPSLSSGESYARDSRAYMNLHIGGHYRRVVDDQKSWTLGTSLFNLSAPKQSFFDEAFVRLDPRWVLHGSYQYKIDEQWTIEPMGLFMNQGKFREFDLGGRVHYTIQPNSWAYEALYAGAFARTKDAGYLLAGIRYHHWDVGVSYDINLSDLEPASNNRGGLEFGVIYIIPPSPKIAPVRKVCPDYI